MVYSSNEPGKLSQGQCYPSLLLLLLYGITQCYLLPDTGECALQYTAARQAVLDSPAPEGWKAELTMVVGYIPRWYTRPHPGTNRARVRHLRPLDRTC